MTTKETQGKLTTSMYYPHQQFSLVLGGKGGRNIWPEVKGRRSERVALSRSLGPPLPTVPLTLRGWEARHFSGICALPVIEKEVKLKKAPCRIAQKAFKQSG